MKKVDKYIEIARTANTPFSSMSSASGNKIQAILSKHYKHVGISTLNTIADLELLTRKQPDLVFLGLKKLPSLWGRTHDATDEVWISEYLEHKHIPYTGSPKAAIVLDFNKEKAKIKVREAGLPTAPSFTAAPGQYTTENDLPLDFPLFVKPLDAGGGKGIGDDSVVRNFTEFQQKVDAIFVTCNSVSLAEQYLTGREFSVAILENMDTDHPMVMPIEIVTEKNTRGDRILGSRVKAEDREQVIAVYDSRIKDYLAVLAKEIYHLLGGRDLGRIDIRMDGTGKAYFLEANFMPGPGTRYFAGACNINEGMDYESVLLNIVGLGLTRNAGPTRDITVAGVYLQ